MNRYSLNRLPLSSSRTFTGVYLTVSSQVILRPLNSGPLNGGTPFNATLSQLVLKPLNGLPLNGVPADILIDENRFDSTSFQDIALPMPRDLVSFEETITSDVIDVGENTPSFEQIVVVTKEVTLVEETVPSFNQTVTWVKIKIVVPGIDIPYRPGVPQSDPSNDPFEVVVRAAVSNALYGELGCF